MGQCDIYEVMRKKPTKWWSHAELAEALGIRKSTASTNIRKLNDLGWLEVNEKLMESGYISQRGRHRHYYVSCFRLKKRGKTL